MSRLLDYRTLASSLLLVLATLVVTADDRTSAQDVCSEEDCTSSECCDDFECDGGRCWSVGRGYGATQLPQEEATAPEESTGPYCAGAESHGESASDQPSTILWSTLMRMDWTIRQRVGLRDEGYTYLCDPEIGDRYAIIVKKVLGRRASIPDSFQV